LLLFISQNPTLVDTFAAALPPSATPVRAPTIEQAGPQLTGAQRPALVVVDTQTNPAAVTQCKQHLQPTVPILAIVARATDREAVLAAGANDYLLLPLLPAEVRARVAAYSNPIPGPENTPPNLKTERLAIVGRLTASLAHELNNPMQTIQGALALALEEINDPQALTQYLQLSQQEAKRVIDLVGQMRQIYHPVSQPPGTGNLNQLLHQAAAVTRQALKRQNVSLRVEPSAGALPVAAPTGEVFLALLRLLLDLSDTLGAAGGGTLHLRSCALPHAAQIELSTQWPLPGAPTFSTGIIAAHGGTLECAQAGEQTVYQIEFPR